MQNKKTDGLPGWKRQLRESIRSLDALSACFPGLTISAGMREAADKFPMAITPYYASLIQKPDFSDPVFAQCVPHEHELISPDWLSEDPLSEQSCSPLTCLVHRYPDRVLIIATSACASYCRHCTRKRVSSQCASSISKDQISACADYLEKHPDVDDVLISGGDPLMLADSTLDSLLAQIRAVKSVKVIRIATRALVTMPMRITPGLVSRLRRHGPLFVNTHFNHPNELTPMAMEAANRLTEAGIPVANQTVLLRGINDAPETIEALCRELFHNRIRPYYLFQCDLVKGIEHLRTPLRTGIDIMRHLRGRLSGMAIPNFAVDTPGAGGKIELLPESIVETTRRGTKLRNSRGETVFYPDPKIG